MSGQTYANYVQQAVLAPCGITDMQIAGNTLKQRSPNEAMYAGQFGENPYNMNIARMDASAGWIATPSDLARFSTHVGGGPGVPSILKPETIRTMTTPTPAYPATTGARYARGWMVSDEGKGNWWHQGSLPGSTSIVMRTANGMCWGAVTNTRTQPSATIDAALDRMVWNMVGKVPGWNS